MSRSKKEFEVFKMKVFVQIWLVVYRFSFVIGSLENIHFGHSIITDAIENEFEFFVFEMTPLNDVQNCVESCKSKKQCKGINYDHRAKLCYHVAFSNTALVGDDLYVMSFIEKKPGFSCGFKEEWDMKEFQDCEGCKEVGVCSENSDPKFSMCKNSGCRLPKDKNNAIYRGNMFSIGNQIAYECKAGYKTNSTVRLTSTCLENGTWNHIEVICLPEAIFGDNVYKFENSSYKLIFERMKWESAKEQCANMNLHLVDIKTNTEQTFIKSIVDRGMCYWTGGVRVQNKFEWLDGEPITNHRRDGWNFWGNGQPNNRRGNSNCIILNKGNLKWNDMECSIKCYVICKFTRYF